MIFLFLKKQKTFSHIVSVKETLPWRKCSVKALVLLIKRIQFLNIQVGYDNSILEKLGSAAAVESYWNSAAPHLQARYCHASLGVKIRIERIGNFKHYAKTIDAGSNSIGIKSVKADTRNDIGDADLMTFMAAHQNIEGLRFITNGVAYGSSVCDDVFSNSNDFKASLNMWQSSAAAYGSVN